MTRRGTLIVMVKEPRPGRVKTRLAADIGAVPAAWWTRHQAARMLRQVTDRRWRTLLAVAPDAEGMASRVWAPGLPRVPQGPGDLGARMGRLLRMPPHGPVLVVGADIPSLGRAQVARGFARLAGRDAVLGPAEDGGYWLVGLSRTRGVPAGLFAGVRWSTPHALGDTLATMRGLDVAFADTLRDVDTGADLRLIRG